MITLRDVPPFHLVSTLSLGLDSLNSHASLSFAGSSQDSEIAQLSAVSHLGLSLEGSVGAVNTRDIRGSCSYVLVQVSSSAITAAEYNSQVEESH